MVLPFLSWFYTVLVWRYTFIVAQLKKFEPQYSRIILLYVNFINKIFDTIYNIYYSDIVLFVIIDHDESYQQVK